MKEYEVFVETINPCGGSRHAQSEFIDVEAETDRNRNRIQKRIIQLSESIRESP